LCRFIAIILTLNLANKANCNIILTVFADVSIVDQFIQSICVEVKFIWFKIHFRAICVDESIFNLMTTIRVECPLAMPLAIIATIRSFAVVA